REAIRRRRLQTNIAVVDLAGSRVPETEPKVAIHARKERSRLVVSAIGRLAECRGRADHCTWSENVIRARGACSYTTGIRSRCRPVEQQVAEGATSIWIEMVAWDVAIHDRTGQPVHRRAINIVDNQMVDRCRTNDVRVARSHEVSNNRAISG